MGYAWFLLALGGTAYYNILICWTLYYLYSSFSAVLPWTTCSNSWNTPSCVARTLGRNTTSTGNGSLPSNPLSNMSTNISVVNISSSWVTMNESSSLVKTNTATEEFWSYHVLNISDGIEHPGDIQLHLLVSQIVAWFIVFLCLVKGIRSVGKVVYVSATVPYVLLLALLIRGLMLPGAVEGIKAFIIPRWEKLLTLQAGAESPCSLGPSILTVSPSILTVSPSILTVSASILTVSPSILYVSPSILTVSLIILTVSPSILTVWIDSATQVMWSCGTGSANIITLSRYNRFHNNCYRDAILVTALDCVSPACLPVCRVRGHAKVGYMADYLGKTPGVVLFRDCDYQLSTKTACFKNEACSGPQNRTVGPGIAFIVYPEALSTMAFGQIWAAVFFIMLFLAGLDSQFVMVEVVIDFLCDTLPKTISKRRVVVTACSCLFLCVLGLPFITQGGAYVLTLVDWYFAAYTLPAIAFMEVAIISWIYGADRLMSDIRMMLGYTPSIVIKISWKFIAPTIILSLWLLSYIKYEPIRYAGQYYPAWAESIGWLLMVIVLIPIPGGAVIKLLSQTGSVAKRYRAAITPSSLWVPAIYKEDAEERQALRERVCEDILRLNHERISLADHQNDPRYLSSTTFRPHDDVVVNQRPPVITGQLETRCTSATSRRELPVLAHALAEEDTVTARASLTTVLHFNIQRNRHR
ncbi:sodium- and chloride-dependent betaine transporter-like [Gigantopelta aegis]|uniref:sodium- and chloride-dependent betaine transporter-like n=1 Tax=Gigantopelta aegis TaxID=1735272 RepID=UPI001B88E2A1|nr:sodium- and chloride-dependent betaine transporter-like [Gigantopelta aegis]